MCVCVWCQLPPKNSRATHTHDTGRSFHSIVISHLERASSHTEDVNSDLPLAWHLIVRRRVFTFKVLAVLAGTNANGWWKRGRLMEAKKKKTTPKKTKGRPCNNTDDNVLIDVRLTKVFSRQQWYVPTLGVRSMPRQTHYVLQITCEVFSRAGWEQNCRVVSHEYHMCTTLCKYTWLGVYKKTRNWIVPL